MRILQLYQVDEKDTAVYVLMYREGKVVGKDSFIIENTEGEERRKYNRGFHSPVL